MNTISPYVRIAMDIYQLPYWQVMERVIWDYEFLYLKEGELIVTIEERIYHGRPGDVFIFKPKLRHSIKVTGYKPVRQPHIHFDLLEQEDSAEVRTSFIMEAEMSEHEKTLFRTDLLSEPPYNLPDYVRLNNPDSFEKLLFELISEFQLKAPFYEIHIKGLMINLLILLIREHHWNQSPQLQNKLQELQLIQRYLNEITDREVSLEELSKEFSISKYYLVRLFKTAFHMSPIQFHRLARFEKAKQLIQYTNLPFKQIADQTGFQNIHAFSRAFKKIAGAAPSAYRR
ncbi:AraC family transcriptional regulator [Paenibacillus psychroresistens]|uniref:AraC family transcriptional regulator n=1 Tax=Paenibacillus psychroresistens TaxID=1778678 RepID=A0A6B8RQW8_9BACL|nr:AraC family transcriptional regulator [Paenibacillus psychroresistens]QGQ98399.1 AraC family transcriptional regulator [Paenibacillus psychroresistens]